MKIDETNIIELEKIRDLKESFDKSMKILESHIAESITNKEKLNSIKSSLVYPVFTGVDDSFKHVRPVVSSSILLTLLQLCKVLLTTFVNFFYV